MKNTGGPCRTCPFRHRNCLEFVESLTNEVKGRELTELEVGRLAEC